MNARYCIDTSSLLHAWNRDYPPDAFPGLWDRFDDLMGDGTLFAPDEVLAELERRADDVFSWSKLRSGAFLPATPDVQGVVRQIVDTWPEFVPGESFDGVWADPYVIGLAKTRGAAVITGENLLGPGFKVPKIPNVCQDLGIETKTVLDVIREQGWRF